MRQKFNSILLLEFMLILSWYVVKLDKIHLKLITNVVFPSHVIKYKSASSKGLQLFSSF